MNDFKNDLAETHVRVADLLQDLAHLAEKDADRGNHCLRYFNRAIDDWMPSFEFVQNQANQQRGNK